MYVQEVLFLCLYCSSPFGASKGSRYSRSRSITLFYLFHVSITPGIKYCTTVISKKYLHIKQELPRHRRGGREGGREGGCCVHPSLGHELRQNKQTAVLGLILRYPPPQNQRFCLTNLFMAARQEEGCYRTLSSHTFLFVKGYRDYRTMASGWQGAPYCRRHGRCHRS